MNKQINFAVISTIDQEMIVNFYPPLEVEQAMAAKIKQYLSATLTKIIGSYATVAELDEEAIGLLEDRDEKQTVIHHTVFGSKLTATFDKMGVRLQVKNGSMVFISAGAQDAIIAIKPGH